jgi:hypothetical protein
MSAAPSPAPSSSAWRRTRREAPALALVFLAGVLVWAMQTGRTTVEAWWLPTVYDGDAHEVLARIQAVSEGDLLPFTRQIVERLGAPFMADWSAYPNPENLPLHVLGLVARLTDVFFASNVGLALAFGLAAASFHWVVRVWLGARTEWAAVTALLFAFNHAVFARGLAHFAFTLTWVVPLGLLACWLVARSTRLGWRSLGAWTCLGAGVLLGSHNTYYLFFWVPLVGWALVAQWLGPRRPANLAIGVATLGVAALTFAAANLDYWLYAAGGDARPLLERNYGGTERYALKPVELIVPPDSHRVATLAGLGARYQRWSEWRGEPFAPYLGLAGFVGLVWLVAITLPRLIRGGRIPGQALTLGWLVTFTTVGGLINIVALFTGLFVFRASNRIGAFVAALLLAFLAVRLSRLSASWRPAWRAAAAATLAVVGLLDQLPARSDRLALDQGIAANVDSDRVFGRALEAALPPGAMVFQLPVLPFPEPVPIERLSDYEHFRPYLVTRDLRFSYGVAKFRPRARWQVELENQPPREIVRRLERAGFAALYLNRKGFADGGEALLDALEDAGYPRRLSSPRGNQIVVFLNPAEQPTPPFGRALTVGRGWQNRPWQGARWAAAEAGFLYYNPLPSPLPVRLTIRLRSPADQTVTLRAGETRVATARLGAGDGELEARDVVLQPGINTFHLDPGITAGRFGGGPLRAIGLLGSSVDRGPRGNPEEIRTGAGASRPPPPRQGRE